MPQLNGGDGDDLGANDELIAFKDEGEQEEKRNASAERDLDDVKSSLVNESESNNSSDSEVSLGASCVINFSSSSTACLCAFPTSSTVLVALCLRFCVCVVYVQADRRPKPNPDLESRARQSQLFEEGNEHTVMSFPLEFMSYCNVQGYLLVIPSQGCITKCVVSSSVC